MPRFKFVASDAQGKETEGVLEAESQARVLALIREKGFFPTSVTEIGATVVRAEVKKSTTGLNREIKLPQFAQDFLAGKVKNKQLMVVTRQLSTLLEAGVPLLRGLQILIRQEAHPTLRKALSGIQESVEGGSTFAEALSNHPKVFNQLYVNMVRAGEAGGVLELVLLRLAEFMEKSERLKNKIKAAMVYPIVVMIIAMAILTFMMVWIVPKFSAIFQGFFGAGKRLPGLTMFVMSVSNNAVRYGVWIVVISIAAVIALRLVYRTTKGRFIIDGIVLRIPIFGKLARLGAVARFARTLGTLLTSGVPILQALTIVSDTVGNAVISKAVLAIHDSVKEGETVAGPMEQSGSFPLMAVSMVQVGEESGALPEMLAKVADTYDNEVDTTVEALTSILEPIMIVLLAVIVGTIVISMFLPIITIISGVA